MAWKLHRENVPSLLRERLDKGHYSNAQHPFLESRFVQPLMEIFPHGREYLAEYEHNGQIVCAFVMSEYSKFTAASYVDGVCQISLTYIDPQLSASELERIVSSLFSALPKFYLAINFELQDPDLTDISKFQAINNAAVNVCAQNTSIPAGVEFAEYWGDRPKKVRKDLERRLRILEREGIQVDYKMHHEPETLEACFKEYCRLEGSGWKGEEGTALTETNEQGRFYKQVMANFMQSGRGVFHELLFNNEVVASLIAIENDEMIIVMKTTYDDELSIHSPGRLIDYFMLRHVLTVNNKKNIENYTNASAQDQKWFPRVREMYDVTVYRSAFVKQAAKLKQQLHG